jgi:hypothetical protein
LLSQVASASSSTGLVRLSLEKRGIEATETISLSLSLSFCICMNVCAVRVVKTCIHLQKSSSANGSNLKICSKYSESKEKKKFCLTLPCDGTRAMNTEQETPHPQNKPTKTTVEEELRKPVERKRGRQDSLVCIFEGHWLRNSETYPETERTQKTEKVTNSCWQFFPDKIQSCAYIDQFFFFFFPDVDELVLVSGTSLVCVRSGDLFATGAKACDIDFMTAWFVFGFLLACAYHQKRTLGIPISHQKNAPSNPLFQ